MPLYRINQKSLASVRPILVICFIFFVLTGLTRTYGVEVYSKEDSPFGLSLDQWLNKWWAWWVATTPDEATAKTNGCLMNKTNSMVFLMETTVVGKPQVCEISSTQGIMIPMWTAFMEDSFNEKGEQPHKGYSYEQLSKAAREEANLGAVTSKVKVDGREIAKLDEISSMKAGKLDYKINSMENVTELYSKGFNVTIPPDTHYPDQNIGTWPSGAHGWFVFLKPLPPGNHTISYNAGVTGAGPEIATEITYALKVKLNQTGNTIMNTTSNDIMPNSNFTNETNLKDTMPNELPPESINGSNIAKI